METPKRVTIRDIAAQTGFSKSCVALALKGSTAVAKDTRKQIQDAANRLGYVPDARVSQLMAYLGKGRASAAACNLAWLNTWPERDYWTARLWTRAYFEGAQDRARTLGYNLEPLWTLDPALNKRTIMRILKARGIEGIVVPMPLASPVLSGIEWGEMAGVIISEHTTDFPLHRAGSHMGHNMLVLMEKLREFGYVRPGLWVGDYTDFESEHSVPSMFEWAQRRLFPVDPILTPLRMNDTPELEEWYPKNKPDVILCASNTVVPRLQAIKVRVPEDVAVVHLHLAEDTVGWAGMRANNATIGARAIETVVAQIHRDERGLAKEPSDLLVRGEWIDGWTAPRKNAKKR